MKKQSNRHLRHGFTLMELLTAMAVGIILINAAMVGFILFRKAVLRTERLVAQNILYQGMMQWVATHGTIDGYPVGKQAKLIGRSEITSTPINILNREIAELRLRDYTQGGNSDIPPLYFSQLSPSNLSTTP
jgi:prepilin-type N-terminal cleavage/methylation domain-containing protein